MLLPILYVTFLAVDTVRVGAQPRVRTATEPEVLDPSSGERPARTELSVKGGSASGSVAVIVKARKVLHHQLVTNRTITWQHQTHLGIPRTPAATIGWHYGTPLMRRLVRLWHDRAEHARHQLQQARARARVFEPTGRPPHYTAWLCIHNGEGAWTSNTGNGYYGGLQFDYEFMSTYGGSLLASKGSADNWTPLEQMWVAERAWRTRGFYPWPQTARACGLI